MSWVGRGGSENNFCPSLELKTGSLTSSESLYRLMTPHWGQRFQVLNYKEFVQFLKVK
jgi:hypothetical protein